MNITTDDDLSDSATVCPPVITMAELIDNAEKIAGNRARYAGTASTNADDGTEKGTRTMRDAVSLARHGWPDGAARMARLSATPTHGRAPAWRPDVAGAFPVAGDYVAGRPDCMRARRTVDDRSTPRAITVYAPVNTNTFVNGDDITTVGAALLGVIDAIETSGTSVRVIACKHNADGSGVRHLYRVLVKNHGEHCDVDRLAFALANPAMPRRLFYAWCEQKHADPRTTRMTKASEGYGRRPPAPPIVPRGDIFLPRVGDDDTYGPRYAPTTATATAGLRRLFAAAGVTLPE